MKITINNKSHEFKSGTTIHDIAKETLKEEEKKIVAGRVNGVLTDLFAPLTHDANLEFVHLSSPDGLQIIRHTAAHVLAQAVQAVYPTAKLTIGPAVADGFFYDIDFKTPITIADLPKIEEEMRRIVKANFRIERKEISRKEAIAKAKANNEPFKVELIHDIPEGEKITIYSQGEWSDICRGPHLRSTGQLKAFKLTKISGAYFKGDEKNKMLTRIYGTAFETKDQMNEYFTMLSEAEKRDHRKVGPELDLFMIDETAPGMPYFLPKGWVLFNTLIDFWRKIHISEGYQEFSGPQINSVKLWKTSGHWDHYQDGMFIVQPKEGKEPEYAVKPMSCPNAIVVYKNKVRSYRELPLRFNDIDVIHRKEDAGALKGLLRVQMFRQDDSHNFITEEQVEAEFNSLFKISKKLYDAFGLSFRAVLSTRPKDYMGEVEVWNKAEASLKAVMDKALGAGNYQINEGDGAFYGPKIDLWVNDCLGRPWQLGTFQLDMQLPLNFDLKYTDRDGKLKTPIIVHRAIFGSLERFIAILIEHYAGAFPFWLAPTQVGIVPIGPEHEKYAKKLNEKLKTVGIRSEAALGDANMNTKVKNFASFKVPYILVVGAKEVENKTVSVRVRSGKQVFAVPFKKAIKLFKVLNTTRNLNLSEEF